jgi:SanA protein
MLRALTSRRWLRRLALGLAGVFAAAVLVVGGTNAYVLLSERGDSTSDVSRLGHAQVALVLGAFVEPDGT